MSDASAKPDRWARFRGLAWWQLVLSVAPLALIAGGLIGGIFGALAMLANLRIARAPLNSAVKALVMLLRGGAAFVLYLIVAMAVLNAVK